MKTMDELTALPSRLLKIIVYYSSASTVLGCNHVPLIHLSDISFCNAQGSYTDEGVHSIPGVPREFRVLLCTS
jgi:hypothetical protein